MVKGISKQVIVVNPANKEMYDQAIFILSEKSVRDGGVTEDMVMKEAKRLINHSQHSGLRDKYVKLLYLFLGAAAVGTTWLFSLLL